MGDSLWLSAKELLRRAVGHYRLFWSGAVAGALGFGLPSVGVQKVPLWVLGWVGISLMVVAVVMAFHDVRIDRDALTERLKSKFEFLENDPACYQTNRTDGQGRYELVRIVIRNGGGSTIDGVRVSIVGIRHRNGEPLHTNVRSTLPLPLIPQHHKDIEPDGTFSLAPGETRPVDVVSVSEKGASSGALRIRHSVSGHEAAIHFWSDGLHLLDIRVVGKDVPAVQKVARVHRDAEGRLALTLVS